MNSDKDNTNTNYDFYNDKNVLKFTFQNDKIKITIFDKVVVDTDPSLYETKGIIHEISYTTYKHVEKASILVDTEYYGAERLAEHLEEIAQIIRNKYTSND